MKAACLAMLLAACCLAQPPEPSGNASITGSVTNSAGEPLRRVTLQLNPLPAGEASATNGPVSSYAAETDAAGNFAFDDVLPGRYTLMAERTGYLPASYASARSPVLTILPGEKMADVTLQMIPQSILAGRVVDDEGEPLSGATVTVTSSRQFNSGAVPSETTNADGVFAIGNLLPGRYVISAAARPNTGAPVKSSSTERPKSLVTTYYPDATDPGAATPVEVAAGAQVRGLEIRLQKISLFKLSGKVVNAATGEPASVESLSLIRENTGAPGLSARSTGVSAAGEFSFDGVLPGDYFLEAKPVAEPAGHPLVGWQTISLGNEDLDRVVVEMKPAVEVTGKIIVEGKPPSSWPQITFTPAEGLNYLDSPVIDVDGHFSLIGLEPAPYRVTIGPVAPPMFIKSVRFNGHDIDSEIDLASGPSASLDIVISDRASSSISGVVIDSAGPVGPNVTVVAAPRRFQGRRIRILLTETDQNGRFSFSNLPAGDYFLAAMETAFQNGNGVGLPLMPELLEKIGTPVTVNDDDSASVELRLTNASELRDASVR
ncbi:MAG TPA: carboxypeptidase-like regulatory domain-containing protein [Bryobacteraceae bacterium]|nr:carboxypeptidase-like regulatory domain-containing protein [Bryobacteraceae bacterium]